MEHGQIVRIERLSLGQRFSLIEIAHETRDHAIKEFALDLLREQQSRPLTVAAQDIELR